jgi:hypothetical protein
VSPGETISVSVDWRETKGVTPNVYPSAVIYLEDGAQTKVGEYDAYAVLACETLPVTGTVAVPGNAPLGTVYKLRAQVRLLPPIMCPDADAIDFSFTVGARIP